MTGKWLRYALISSGALLVVLAAAGFAGLTAGAKGLPGAASGYVGATACFGCHADQYEGWTETGHAHMLTFVFSPQDLPADPATAPPELQAELNQARYIVAGQRFIARNPDTGALSYLNVRYDAATGTYVPYKGGADWEQNCAGCHTTGWDSDEGRFVDAGISCEACHGPGREHILGKGDLSKIVRSTDAAVCGSCHVAGSMPDGTRWPEGWQPGMHLEAVGYQAGTVDPDGPVPPASLHLRQYPLISASGHLDASPKPMSTHHDNPNCYTCHSAEARIAAADGHPITDLDFLRHTTDGVSCVACHDPHQDNGYPAQLRMAPGALCANCHTASLPEGGTAQLGSAVHHPQKEMLAGYGAIGVEPTRGVHSRDDVSCVDCHMTEGNHLFRVILPSTVAGTDRQDSCVACHDASTTEIRGAYLEMWQDQATARLEAVKAKLEQAEGRLGMGNVPTDLADKVKLARTNISYVEADKSRGAHNFEYTMKMLAAADRALTEFAAATR